MSRRMSCCISNCARRTDAEGTREMVEAITRPTVGTEDFPIEDISAKKVAHRYIGAVR